MLVAVSCLLASLGIRSGLNIVNDVEGGLKDVLMKLAMIPSACSDKARLLSKVCVETGMPAVASGNARLQALGFSGFV